MEWTSLASLMGMLMLLQSFMQILLPADLRRSLPEILRKMFTSFSSYYYFDITEIDGVNTNELYNAVHLYLSSSPSVSGSRRSLSRAVNSSAVTFGISSNELLTDTFSGTEATWQHIVTPRPPNSFSWRPVPDDKRSFVLRLKKQQQKQHDNNANSYLDLYLGHIMERAAEIKRRSEERFLYTNARGGALDSRGQPWEPVPFKHPSTFDTLALDPSKKEEIKVDLRDFADGEEFYKRTGRAWKRGYLLYGPPGTGKSSMIAAMANYLAYDIYDLELTEVHTNSELRKLLMKTTPKSIIVIEDIDCSLSLSRKRNRSPPSPPCTGESDEHGRSTVTLSGLLNFTDGLWSCCGSERIFIFTTNHVERLDPALLRSGRMDMHVCMGYCSLPSLKILIKNYVGVKEDDDFIFDEIGLVKELEEAVNAAEITPADVSEVLIKNRRMEKKKAVHELLVVLKARGAAKMVVGSGGGGGGGGIMKKGFKNEELLMFEEEEEQEKRALESPKENGDPAMDDQLFIGNSNNEKLDNA